MVATVIAQRTLLVGQRRHNGGTQEAETSPKLMYNVYDSTHFLQGNQWLTPVHLFCKHGYVCAFILPVCVTNFLSDLCAIVLNMLKTSLQSWHPWQGLNILFATLEGLRQPFRLFCAFNGELVSFVVTQGKYKGHSPCVKGVLLIRFVMADILCL